MTLVDWLCPELGQSLSFDGKRIEVRQCCFRPGHRPPCLPLRLVAVQELASAPVPDSIPTANEVLGG